ncbi:acyltransferase family protein [Flavitalea flava]
MRQRFYSLDVFRGATVALMILVNNPGNWSYIYAPLEHAPWHGCTPTDLVFPFFLFAVGNAMAFVLPRLEAAGDAAFLKKVITRTLLIFFIGLFLNWFPFIKWSGGHLVFKAWTDPADPSHPLADPTGIRILGVLQRIALAYCLANLILYYTKIRGAFVSGAVILLGYWVSCSLLGNPADPFSLHGYFGTNLDKAVLGVAHMYKGEGVAFDPEGLASTLPAVVQVIFGYLVGHTILQKGKTYEMISGLFVTGCVLVFAGFCWDTVFPVNKKIWSSSFVVYTTGLAILVLSVLLYLIEMKGRKGFLTRFFDVFGKNALFIFMVSGILPRIYGLFRIADGTDAQGANVYKGLKEWMYDHLFSPAFGLMNGSLAYAIFNILLFWVLCYVLDKKKIYIKV